MEDQSLAVKTTPSNEGARRYASMQKRLLRRGGNVASTSIGDGYAPLKVPSKKNGRAEHTPEYRMLRRHSHRLPARIYRILLHSLVFTSTVNFILADERYFQDCCMDYFNIFEGVVSTLFLMEYLLKVYTVPQRRAFFSYKVDWEARQNFIFSSESLIDLVSFLPFFFEVSFGISPNKYELFRMLQLVRLLKLPILWDSFRMLGRVLYFNHTILNNAFLVCFVMLLACSVVLFYLRPPLVMDHIDNFSSILSCMYLSVLMLTGQGEPNGQLPWYTRVIVSVTALFAIAQFAIPASMLTWGFEQEAEQNIKKNDKREGKVVGYFLKGKFSEDACVSSSSSDESDRNEEWEAYEKQVTGDESSSSSSDDSVADDDDEDEETYLKKKWSATQLSRFEKKRIRHMFRKLSVKGPDGKRSITRERIDRMAQKDGKLVDPDAGQHLFENMCNKIDTNGKVVVCEFSRITNRIIRLQFYNWLSYVKITFPRYGDAIFIKLLDTLEDKAEEIEDSGVNLTPISEQEAPITATVSASKLGTTCFGGIRSLTRRARKSKTQSDPIAPLTSQQLFTFAEQMRTLETENATLQARATALEEEINMLKVPVATS